MKWLIENWSFLLVVGCALCVAFFYFKKFTKLPSDAQMEKVKAWLLYAVIQAQKEFGEGTGRLKLVAVYSQFIDKFPAIAPVVTFEMFSRLVDEALVEMRKILETNKDIETYVKGK